MSLSPATATGSAPAAPSRSSRISTSHIEGKNVLIVEDILDTGLTLAYLRKLFAQQHPKSLRIATLLDKPSRRIEKIDADYVGFSIPNLFVIGYGMDYGERYRNLPDICIMPPDQPA
ncbi:MAG: phosphoribosyltransferase family protein [Terracidiphilus sp.]